jgi:hypothetical protein
MTKQELRKGAKAWCWWKSRMIYYTGREVTRGGVHYYIFEDICDAITEITDEQLSKLEIR